MVRNALRYLALILVFSPFLLMPLSSTMHAQGPLYPCPTDRFGVGLPPDFAAITDYDVASLRVAWYSDWAVSLNPPRPSGIDYAQLIWVSQGTFSPSLAQLGPMVDANPGSVWMIGNEPECIWQSNNTPEQYAGVYHQLYEFIKGRDSTAQIAIGGVVEPTPLRLEWLDRVLNHYQATYRRDMPVDVWNIHIQILQELQGSWGCEIPCGLDATSGRLYTVQDNDNIEIFQQLIVDFRTWLRDRGERNKPLIISEYGILMPVEYGFTPERVNAYMDATFDYLLAARDDDLGYAADESRLVQRWLWYSLNEQPYDFQTGKGYNGPLFDYRYPVYPGVITEHGINFREYTSALPPYTAIQGKVTLQRPDQPAPDPSWSVPLTVTVCGTPHQVTCDESGRFSLTGLMPGTCDIVVKNAHTLGNIRRGHTLVLGVNAIDMGELVEGDANGDNCVNILDFSILRTVFLRSDARADFNEDGIVNISDFSLLATNFARCGDIVIWGAPSDGSGPQAKWPGRAE